MPKFYQAQNLNNYSQITHGFTTRSYGNLSWQSATDEEQWTATLKAQAELASDLGIKAENIVNTYQKHSKNVFIVRSRNSTSLPSDALVTDLKGIGIMVHSADCVPVLFFDPVIGVVGAAHAGWRGVLNGVCVETVISMAKEYDSEPSNVRVAIGPSIGPCHFEVKNDVWKPFVNTFHDPGVFIEKPGSLEHPEPVKSINLWWAIKEQLVLAGVAADNIETLGMCTYCNPEFASFRRDKRIGVTMGSIIAIK